MQNSGNSSPETGQPTPAPNTPRSPTRKRFALSGRRHGVDPRVDAARGDLADLRLADRLFAPHYAAAVLRTVVRQTPLRAIVSGEALSEVLIGEPFEVLELTKGNAWGTSPIDGAVGFVDVDALGPFVEATHMVAAPGGALPMGSRLVGPDEAAIPITTPAEDFATVAESLVGTPAVEGGRSGGGIDGSGLVFLALSLAGVPAPRFADLQQALGHDVAASAPMLRGDLLFTVKGPAIVIDGEQAVHVGEAVAISPIADLGDIVARRRLP